MASRRDVLAFVTVLALLLASAGGVEPSSAAAAWRKIAPERTAASPYYICPPQPRRLRCGAIEDPTGGLQRSGPVAAGAITKGPEQEVSPAFEGSGVDGGYSPANLQNAYDLGSASGGAGQTVAVVDPYDDPDAEADLETYRSHYGLPPCASGCFQQVDEASGNPSREELIAWAKETSLDLDMVSAICPSCHILLVEAANKSASSLASAEDEAVRLGATAISNSYVGYEASEGAYAAAYHHAGIPITAAAGDEGYAAGVAAPASGTYVIAVGGTTLKQESHHWSESVWSETGSGCGGEQKPTWQEQLGQADSGCAGRSDNDVAVVGDPNTPVSVYDSYEESGAPWRVMGGTSVGAPIVAALMAQSTAFTRSFEGAGALYAATKTGYSFYRDIAGRNGSCGNYLCEAQPEVTYDGPTGLGSPRGVPDVTEPALTTKPPVDLTSSGATLEATVDPEYGELERCDFEYGPTTSYGSSAACDTTPRLVAGTVEVSAALSGLPAGRPYHFRVTVGYRDGTTASTDATFTTRESSVSASAARPSLVKQTYATLTGAAEPNGATIAGCAFEYGTTTSYGSSIECTPKPSGLGAVAVSATVTGLAPAGSYHYRLALRTAEGSTADSGDVPFQTLPEPPGATTEAVTSLSGTSATLNADVDPAASLVELCEFEFSGSPAVLACPSELGSGSAFVPVSAAVTGLAPDTTYSYRIVAGNGGGVSYGAIATFSTPQAPATIGPSPIVVLPTPDVALTSAHLQASRNGTLSVKLTCPLGESECVGTLSLRTLTAVRVTTAGHLDARRILTLGSATFRLGGGGRATVFVRLDAAARALLAHKALRARATIQAHDALGSTHATSELVTIEAPRKR
jgi:hypothetical protein